MCSARFSWFTQTLVELSVLDFMPYIGRDAWVVKVYSVQWEIGWNDLKVCAVFVLLVCSSNICFSSAYGQLLQPQKHGQWRRDVRR